MKKLICIVLSLCLLLALTACGSDEKPAVDNSNESANNNDVQSPATPENNDEDVQAPTAGEEDVQTPVEQGFVFTHNGVDIVMNAPAADVLAGLGTPKSQTEEPSCAFEGLDKTYYYGSFYLQTYPMEDADYIYCLWFVDDTITTAEGIYIGASEAQVKAAYGEDAFNGSNAYVITKGDSKLSVIIEGGVVTQITYDAIVM